MLKDVVEGKMVAGRGPWRQAGGRGPLSGQLEKVESGQSRASVRPHSEGPWGLRVTPLA